MPTTREAALEILASEEFASGRYSTSFLDEVELEAVGRVKVLGPDVKVTDGALAQIVVRAAEGVDGVRVRRPRRKVAIEVEGTHARVDLSLAIAYGKVLPDVARDVQQRGRGRARAHVRPRRRRDRRLRRRAGRAVSAAISRREARRAAVFLLYQWDVTETPLGSLYEGEVDEYTRRVAEAVAAHAAELDARITAASDDWTADRLGAVERNVLRVAVEELDAAEVPLEVVLDEAVTLAKRYASDDAGRLVNGILGRIVREKAA